MFLAKSKPKETLVEHTQQLIIRYNHLYEAYGDRIPESIVWQLLKLAALYHDTGKSYSYFQYTIMRSLGMAVEKPRLFPIPHNYLSPFFLPIKALKLNKHDRRILIQSITYHHERDYTIDDEQLLKIAYDDLMDKFQAVQRELNIEVPKDGSAFQRILQDMKNRRFKQRNNDKTYFLYILVKGLLHRLDHAASAHVPIEIDETYDLSEMTKNYLQKITNRKQDYLRPLQQFALNHQNKNLIIIAQTGMGKTESALLWAGKDKLFFTLPIRTSLNALFDRIVEDMGYKRCGLLHSSSANHLNDKGEENWEIIYDQSKHFASKLTFTTIDQILKIPFKFRGYEKYYATLAYSRVVIDEIQAYSPWIVAVIIKAIEMIHAIGGKFMIMTATLPSLYVEELKKRKILNEECMMKAFSDDTVLRHRFVISESSILDNEEIILEKGEKAKVLVIVNTVNRAVQLYEKLVKKTDDVFLLHSRFLLKDRQLLEKQLKKFDKDRSQTGIWVTTQIVEASIDVDFDYLFVELAPLDSLFQRFGRCYRKRKLTSTEANIMIFVEDVSGNGMPYDKEIMERSKQSLIEHFNRNGGDIYENQKMDLVRLLYERTNLQGTKFLKTFDQALRELDEMEDYQVTHEEAQKILRGDHSVTVIPRSEYDRIIPLFEQLEVEEDSRKRTEIRRQIEKHTCSVYKGMFKRFLQPIEHFRETENGKYPLMNYIYILDKPYDFDSETLKGTGIKNDEIGFEMV